jgi:hypothetical protein
MDRSFGRSDFPRKLQRFQYYCNRVTAVSGALSSFAAVAGFIGLPAARNPDPLR